MTDLNNLVMTLEAEENVLRRKADLLAARRAGIEEALAEFATGGPVPAQTQEQNGAFITPAKRRGRPAKPRVETSQPFAPGSHSVVPEPRLEDPGPRPVGMLGNYPIITDETEPF